MMAMDDSRLLVWIAVAVTGVLMLFTIGVLAFRRPPRPAATLIGRSGQFRGVTVPIPVTGLVLGRDPGAGHLRFADDSDLSRQHCRVAYDEAARCFCVTDLGSSNGSFGMPQGERLGPHREWRCPSGQLIRLGRDTVFELHAR